MAPWEAMPGLCVRPNRDSWKSWGEGGGSSRPVGKEGLAGKKVLAGWGPGIQPDARMDPACNKQTGWFESPFLQRPKKGDGLSNTLPRFLIKKQILFFKKTPEIPYLILLDFTHFFFPGQNFSVLQKTKMIERLCCKKMSFLEHLLWLERQKRTAFEAQ